MWSPPWENDQMERHPIPKSASFFSKSIAKIEKPSEVSVRNSFQATK